MAKRMCVAEGCNLAGGRRGSLCDRHYARMWAGRTPPPRTVTCVECATVREVGPRGRLPKLCETCEQTAKWCPSCESVLPRTAFSKTRGARLGLYAQCKPCHGSKQRGRIYGLSPSDVDDMVGRQEGKCASCGDSLAADMNIDHCHATGQVRGLLCGPCNRGLGCFRDDPVRLELALGYLRRTSEVIARG